MEDFYKENKLFLLNLLILLGFIIFAMQIQSAHESKNNIQTVSNPTNVLNNDSKNSVSIEPLNNNDVNILPITTNAPTPNTIAPKPSIRRYDDESDD